MSIMSIDSTPLITSQPEREPSYPISLKSNDQSSVIPRLFPRILCNQSGSVRWKRIANYIERYSLSVALSYTSILIIIHIVRSVFCAPIPVPWYIWSDGFNVMEPCSVESFFAEFLILPLVNALPFALLCMIPGMLLIATQPNKNAYKKYALSILNPLFEQNQFKLIYKNLFIKNPKPTLEHQSLLELREDFSVLFIEKLLEVHFFKINIIDKLILSGVKDSEQTECYEMCAKKMWERDQDPELICSIIAGIHDENKQFALLQEYAIWELTSFEYVSSVLLHNRDLAEIVIAYTGALEKFQAHGEGSIEDKRYEGDAQYQKITIGNLVSTMTPIVRHLANQRKKHLEALVEAQKETGHLFNQSEICAALSEFSGNFRGDDNV